MDDFTGHDPWQAGQYRLAFAVLATVFFMWGFITVLNDVLVPHLKSVFELTYAQALMVQMVFFSTYLIMALPSSWVLERIGYKRAIALGLAIAGVGALIFLPAATLPSFAVFLLGLFVLASGITLLQVAANPYVAMLGPPRTASSRLNLAQALNSLGTTLAPAVGGMLILSRSVSGEAHGAAVFTLQQRMQDALAVRLPYIGLAVVLFVLAGLILAWKLPSLAAARAGSKAAPGDSLWRHPRLILGVVGIFVYVGAEVATGSLLINYISSPSIGDMSNADAAHYVSYFWGGAMVGRFIGAGLMQRISPARMLGFNAAAACVLIAISILASGHVSMWSIIMLGLCNSIMFPTIFTLSIEGLGPLTGRGSGLLIMAIFGGALIPWLQGALSDSIGLQLAFVLPAACYLYILFFAFSCRGSAAGPATLDGEAAHIAEVRVAPGPSSRPGPG